MVYKNILGILIDIGCLGRFENLIFSYISPFTCLFSFHLSQFYSFQGKNFVHILLNLFLNVLSLQCIVDSVFILFVANYGNTINFGHCPYFQQPNLYVTLFFVDYLGVSMYTNMTSKIELFTSSFPTVMPFISIS